MEQTSHIRLESPEIANNRASIALWLTYGKKWGLFTLLSNTKRTLRHESAGGALAFLIQQWENEGGLTQVDKRLQEIDRQIVAHGGDLRILKEAVINARKKDFGQRQEEAQRTQDHGLLASLELHSGLIAISERDMAPGNNITVDNIRGPITSQLPTWYLKIIEQKALPEEVEATLASLEKPVIIDLSINKIRDAVLQDVEKADPYSL